jgi:hypothetical protein
MLRLLVVVVEERGWEEVVDLLTREVKWKWALVMSLRWKKCAGVNCRFLAQSSSSFEVLELLLLLRLIITLLPPLMLAAVMEREDAGM